MGRNNYLARYLNIWCFIYYIYTSCSSATWELNYTRSWMEKNSNPVIIFQVYQRIEIYIIDQPS